MKADHNTPFDVKVMSKYKVLSKRECGVNASMFKAFFNLTH